MEDNQGFVIYNTFLKGYFSNDEHFVSKLSGAKIFTDDGTCKWKMKKISTMYKEVESFDEKNLEIKKVSVQIIE